MFNLSKIMKAAHAYVRAYRDQYPHMTYRELLAWGLAAHWAEAKQTDADRIANLKAEHIRRQHSDNQYFTNGRHAAMQASIKEAELLAA